MEFNNKIVWITGASSGIGEATAKLFAQKGAKLVLSARNVKELERVAKNCQAKSENIFVLPLDLTNHDSMPEKTKQVAERFGKIDVLFNNGGVSQRSLASQTSFEVDKKLMDINYFGAVSLTKAVLPYMISQKSGNILVMSSLTGKIGVPMRSAYAASKHALHGFFDTLRAENYKNNIKVMLVCAGYVQTKISQNALTADGSPQNKEDGSFANAMTPELVAQKIIRGIEKDKKELLLGGKEKFGVVLKRFFPNLFFKIIQNHKEELG